MAMKSKLRETYSSLSYDRPDPSQILPNQPNTSHMGEIKEETSGHLEKFKEEVYKAKMDLVDEYEGEDYEEYSTATDRTLFEKILEEDKVIEPSPETQKWKETSADMVLSIQYPQ